MLYKVFLVEDEIEAREGIRDNVAWKSAGFEFCGEAPDGEIALPLIEATQPDVLITDIRMPFMDGLQLCKIIREHMPWVKIIILSGHDEFSYAQTAIKLGVTEYLLKPVSSADLFNVLQKLTTLLDQDKKERETLKRLRDQVEDNLLLLRERFLLRLAMGGESYAAAVEQSQELGLDIIAEYYLVMLVKIEMAENARSFDFSECQIIEQVLGSMAVGDPNLFLTKKDVEEWVLILRGSSSEHLENEAVFLAESIKREVGEKTSCRLNIGIGDPQQRLGDIHRSFSEALIRINDHNWGSNHPALESERNRVELVKLDQSALESFLKSGNLDGFEEFFTSYIQPLSEAALRLYLVKQYMVVDIVLTSAQFVSDLGGNVDQVFPEIREIEGLLASVKTIEQIKAETRRIITNALAYRDSQVGHERSMIIHQAKTYIDTHFSDPDLSLREVAAHISLSPSHFSAIFSHETGQPFRDYLTAVRIDWAKELLRMTNLKSAEIAYQSGYNDPHYFSYFFKKITGQTPQQFRSSSKMPN